MPSAQPSASPLTDWVGTKNGVIADRAKTHRLRGNRDRGNDRSFSPPTPPGMRVRTGRFRKIEPVAGWRFKASGATRVSPLDRLPFRLHRLLNLASSAA